MKRIAINGLGRIGRKLTHNLGHHNDIEIVAINDIMPMEMAIYFLKYDSTYGLSKDVIEADENYIIINGKRIQYSSVNSISDLPWKNLNIDIAINCSGTNKSKPQLTQYLSLGIPKVILSSPPDNEDIPILILGYNEKDFIDQPIISNGSCTTYCVAPILDIFERNYGIEFANFTTVHCYTSDQNLQDAYHQDFRRSRAAGVNIIPTTTSATNVIKRIFPQLKDKVMGSSFRVPVINGSITEFIIELKRKASVSEIISCMDEEAKTNYNHVIGMTNDKLVSTDVINSSFAGLIDMNSLEICGQKIKLTVFYDNEAGYSSQLVRLIEKMTISKS